MISIVDYGVGNLGSIRNMLKKLGHDSEIVSDPAQLRAANKLILPGVGAFDPGMGNLVNRGFVPYLNEAVLERRIPVLGICLGMQLMTRGSEEGTLPGLGWIPATTIKFQPSESESVKFPHMGWNVVSPVKDSKLLAALPEQSRFYFVHSFHVRCDRTEDVLLHTSYGGTTFDAAFEVGNVFGAQFHPEKSHKFGLRFLDNFAKASIC